MTLQEALDFNERLAKDNFILASALEEIRDSLGCIKLIKGPLYEYTIADEALKKCSSRMTSKKDGE